MDPWVTIMALLSLQEKWYKRRQKGAEAIVSDFDIAARVSYFDI